MKFLNYQTITSTTQETKTNVPSNQKEKVNNKSSNKERKEGDKNVKGKEGKGKGRPDTNTSGRGVSRSKGKGKDVKNNDSKSRNRLNTDTKASPETKHPTYHLRDTKNNPSAGGVGLTVETKVSTGKSKGVNKKDINILTNHINAPARITAVFISVAEVKELLQKEGWDKNPDVDSYTTFICMNVWCSLFQDITGMSGELLALRLKLNGIKFTILEADEYRISFIKESPNSNSFWHRYLEPLGVCEESLTLVGYPRRMRIIGKDSTDEQVKFIKGNKKCKNHNRTWTMPTLLTGLDRKVVGFTDPRPELPPSEEGKTKEAWLEYHTYTPEFLLNEASRLWEMIFEDWKQDIGLFVLPPGTSCEGANTYLDKFKIVLQQQNWLRDHGVNIPWYPYSNGCGVPVDYCRYNLVPKTFKTLRGIAPEPVSKQVLGYQVDSGMRKCLETFGCNLNDQSKNQRMSKELSNATEDISAASDSISLYFVSTISQGTPELHKQLMAVRSNKIVLGDRVITNYRYATMGNVCTFSTEAAIFLISCIISYELYHGKKILSKAKLRKLCKQLFGVYGDDCVLPAYLHDLFRQVCEYFGFTVNSEKSFADGLFRESCGAEWYNGNLVTGTYWPRGLSKVPLAELVSMQHKLVAYPTANSFLVGVILDVFPDITQSEIGSPYQDIWCESPFPRFKGTSVYAKFTYRLEYWKIRENLRQEFKRSDAERKATWPVITIPAFEDDTEFHKYWCEHQVCVWDEKPEIFGVSTHSYHAAKWARVLTPVKSPHDENLELHTTLTSESTGKIPEDERAMVEYLAYLLTIGGGIEHVNSSPYTKPQDSIRNRRDLVGKRKVKISNKVYPV